MRWWKHACMHSNLASTQRNIIATLQTEFTWLKQVVDLHNNDYYNHVTVDLHYGKNNNHVAQ